MFFSPIGCEPPERLGHAETRTDQGSKGIINLIRQIQIGNRGPRHLLILFPRPNLGIRFLQGIGSEVSTEPK